MFSQKIFLAITVFFLLTMLMMVCSKKEEPQRGESGNKEGAREDQLVETIKPMPVNYDSILIIINGLTEAVKNNLADVELRKKLVDVSYDTTWDTILAAGFGKPVPTAETESIAMKYAEQAATLDAYRWAAYIKKWHFDPSAPEVGTITAGIQGGRVVAKTLLPDHSVSVLVEIQSSKIQ